VNSAGAVLDHRVAGEHLMGGEEGAAVPLGRKKGSLGFTTHSRWLGVKVRITRLMIIVLYLSGRGGQPDDCAILVAVLIEGVRKLCISKLGLPNSELFVGTRHLLRREVPSLRGRLGLIVKRCH
jgi:hypothetical protein